MNDLTSIPINSPRAFYARILNGVFSVPTHADQFIPWRAVEEFGYNWAGVLDAAGLPAGKENDQIRGNQIHDLIWMVLNRWEDITGKYAPSWNNDQDKAAFENSAPQLYTDNLMADYSDPGTVAALSLPDDQMAVVVQGGLTLDEVAGHISNAHSPAVAGLVDRFRSFSPAVQILIVLVIVFLVKRILA